MYNKQYIRLKITQIRKKANCDDNIWRLLVYLCIRKTPKKYLLTWWLEILYIIK